MVNSENKLECDCLSPCNDSRTVGNRTLGLLRQRQESHPSDHPSPLEDPVSASSRIEKEVDNGDKLQIHALTIQLQRLLHLLFSIEEEKEENNLTKGKYLKIRITDEI